MAENVTREEIAEMIEFVRGELSNREFGGHESEYVASARRSLAIAEKLPALLAERGNIDFVTALQIAHRGFEAWKDKPHNAKWFRRIDGTPIPDDLLVNIANEIVISPPFYAPAPLIAERDRLAAEVERLEKDNDDIVKRQAFLTDTLPARVKADWEAALKAEEISSEKWKVAQAEVERLTKERDDARRLATTALSQAQDWRNSAETARETIAKLREALKATGSVASALLEHFNPTNLAEAVAQQWFALHDQVTVFNAGVLAQLDAAPEPVKWTHSTRGRYEVIIMPADRAPDVECGRERECAIESFEVANDGGKRWRIEARFVDGRSFALKPDGEITATEAERICLRIAAALGFHEAAPDDQAMIDIPVATSLEQALREADRHVARLREYHAAWAEDWDRKLMARAESETVQDANDGGAK